MFQTDIHHFLQSFENPVLTAIMQFFTALGYTEFFIIFLIIMFFCFDLKKAFLLFQILLWVVIITMIAKFYFDLPRPFHVDNSIEFLDRQLPDETSFSFSKRGATSFFGLLPDDVLEVTRSAEGLQNGFPSGHTSVAIAFWAGMVFLFRNKAVKVISFSLMFLIPFSRVYLGVHFLADVLGGAFIGGLFFLVLYKLFFKTDWYDQFLRDAQYQFGLNWVTFLLVGLPLLSIGFLPFKMLVLPGVLIGLGIGYILLGMKGIPLDQASIGKKIGRLLIGLITTIGIIYGMKTLGTSLGLNSFKWFNFIISVLGFIYLIWGSIELSIKLGLYKRT